MQALQPQIKEIQAKFKNDKQRMQQEMMNFYKENKVNPFASCIPLLAQFPVFIALFSVLRTSCRRHLRPDGKAAALRGSQGPRFLFIPDLTAKATGGVLIALLVLYVVTQLISGVMMTVTADKSQRTMMLALPLVFVTFIINFPAGLILYWITTNVWTIGQPYTFQKVIPAPALATPEEVAAAKPPPPPAEKRRSGGRGEGRSLRLAPPWR